MAESDVPAMVEACQDPEIFRFTRVPEPYTEREATWWLGESARQLGQAEGLHLLTVDDGDGALLGSVGLTGIDWEERRCEIGYWVARAARGEGVGTRSVRLLSSWVFGELGLDKVTILADVENAASRAVAERAGFAEEGLLRSHILIAGQRRDVASYGLLRAELD